MTSVLPPPAASDTADPGAPPQYGYAPPVATDRFTAFVRRVSERTPRWAPPAAAALGVVAGVGYTLLVHPTTAPPTCILRMLTGLDCPGCGGTRAAWYLLHGNLPAAARHHAPFVFSVPFLAYMYVMWSLRAAFGWRVPMWRISTRTLIGFLGVWLAFSVLRNLPFEPFSWLYV